MKLKKMDYRTTKIKRLFAGSEVFIECPNGLMVSPKAKMWIDLFNAEEEEKIKGTVITPG